MYFIRVGFQTNQQGDEKIKQRHGLSGEKVTKKASA